MPNLIPICLSGLSALVMLALAPKMEGSPQKTPKPPEPKTSPARTTSRNPKHSFSTPGPKVVELTVCNAFGCSTVRKTLTVLSSQPKIDSVILPARVGSAELAAPFSAKVSGRPVLKVVWKVSGRWGSEALTGTPVTWWPDALGSHTVRATVSNSYGQASSAPMTLLVVPSNFADVSAASPIFEAVETVSTLGLVSACGPGRFCPQDPVSRSEGTVFLSHALAAQAAPPPSPPPPDASPFADVPLSHWAFEAIYQLYLQGIAEPCATNPLRFCPEETLRRGEAAVFLVRSRHGGQFVPPAVTGRFADVPPGLPAAPYVEQLARDGITSGCSPTLFCPEEAVSRAAMASFLVPTFHLVAQPHLTRFELGAHLASYAAGLPLPVTLSYEGGLPASFEYDWDGNGSFEEVSSVPVASHAYGRAGLFRPAVRLRQGGAVHSLAVETPLTITAANYFLTPARPAGVSVRFVRQVDPTPADPPGTLARTAFAVRGNVSNLAGVLGYLAYLSFDRSTYSFLAMLPADLSSDELLTPRLGSGRTGTLFLRAFNAYGPGPASVAVPLSVP